MKTPHTFYIARAIYSCDKIEQLISCTEWLKDLYRKSIITLEQRIIFSNLVNHKLKTYDDKN